MRITIQASSGQAESEVDLQLHRAFVALHDARIDTRGGGRFTDGETAIILLHATDALKALAALKSAGIQAPPRN